MGAMRPALPLLLALAARCGPHPSCEHQLADRPSCADRADGLRLALTVRDAQGRLLHAVPAGAPWQPVLALRCDEPGGCTWDPGLPQVKTLDTVAVSPPQVYGDVAFPAERVLLLAPGQNEVYPIFPLALRAPRRVHTATIHLVEPAASMDCWVCACWPERDKPGPWVWPATP
ncbi:MAG: hypothetical protein ABIO70_23770 [Pseudomonadota bacterium]